MSLQSSGFPAFFIIDKKGNEEKEEKEESTTLTSLKPIEDQMEVAQEEDDKMTAKTKEQVAI